MATPRALLSQEEYEQLRSHLRKHKSYPYNYSILKTTNLTNFPTLDGGGIVRYTTFQFTPTVDTGIVSLATNLLITPETTFGIMGIQMSYVPTLSLADNPTLTAPANEGAAAYNLFVNGGAINDFQVFYPLNYYVRSRETLFIHVFVDTTTVATATASMKGQIILGTFPLTN